MPHPARKSYATFAPEIIEFWARFREHGEVRLDGLTRREANSMKRTLYVHRLRLLTARDEGDALAGELYEAAQDAYLTVELDATGPPTTFSLVAVVNPLKRALATLDAVPTASTETEP